MSFQEIESLCNNQAFNYVTMGAKDGRYFKGQSLVLNSISALPPAPTDREIPFVKFICIESGEKDSKWQFVEELF